MTVQSPAFTPPPFQSGPEWGGPAGYQNFVIPAAMVSAVSGGATIITLRLPQLLEWFSKYIVPQQVFGGIADATTTGLISLKVNGTTYPVYLNSARAAGSNININDYCQFAYDNVLGGFHLLNWSQLGSGGGSTGNEVIVTTAGPFTVAANTSALILNKAAPSPTSIILGPSSLRSGLPLVISDFAGNAGDITITPDAADTAGIMGLPTLTIGTGGAATLYPNATLLGWAKGN